ncbi:DUF4097 family beta strand repeat-containing protein [Streptomyces sp. NPDC006610]|uniref:DUF4097 family beta strand repeat-containing protein n=1 Tax=Streptomyces sp. NPDC006610 TaxID=3154584 RepID=UPI0033A0A06B
MGRFRFQSDQHSGSRPSRSGNRSRPLTRSALGAAGLGVLLVGLTGCASAEEDKDAERRAFALSGRTLTVDSDDSRLEIVAVEGAKEGEVRVTRWFDGSVVVGKDPKVSWEMQDGDRLVLRLHCSGFVADCEARHRIEVPRGVAVKVREGDGSVRASGFREALDIRTGDGSVRVEDVTGAVKVRTGDGSVRVGDVDGAVNVETGDGSVRVQGVSGALDVHTRDGSVRADVDSREVRTRTGDGSVDLQLGVIPDLVESRSGDGSVTISLPRAAYRVSTETGDGGVDVSVPRDERSEHVVTARTGDGKVTVRTAN